MQLRFFDSQKSSTTFYIKFTTRFLCLAGFIFHELLISKSSAWAEELMATVNMLHILAAQETSLQKVWKKTPKQWHGVTARVVDNIGIFGWSTVELCMCNNFLTVEVCRWWVLLFTHSGRKVLTYIFKPGITSWECFMELPVESFSLLLFIIFSSSTSAFIFFNRGITIESPRSEFWWWC